MKRIHPTAIFTCLLLSVLLPSCEAVTGIFSAGMGFGIFLVVAVIVLIVIIILKVGKNKNE